MWKHWHGNPLDYCGHGSLMCDMRSSVAGWGHRCLAPPPQERTLLQVGGSSAWRQAYYMPGKGDTGVASIRTWFDRYGAAFPLLPHTLQDLPPLLPREQALDRCALMAMCQQASNACAPAQGAGIWTVDLRVGGHANVVQFVAGMHGCPWSHNTLSGSLIKGQGQAVHAECELGNALFSSAIIHNPHNCLWHAGIVNIQSTARSAGVFCILLMQLCLW